MPNNIIGILSFSIILMMCFVYFKKKRINSFENKTYSLMIITDVFITLFAILFYFTTDSHIIFLRDFIGKGICVLFVLWYTLFGVYLFSLIYTKIKKRDYLDLKSIPNKVIIIFVSFFVILSLAIIFLPLNYYSNGVIKYSYGSAANVVYFGAIVIITLSNLTILIFGKNLLNKKIIPIYIFILLGIISWLVQKNNPGILLTSFTDTFLTLLMYFTIENPDINMLNELYKNKELMEQNYEDKYNFLFEMTQEARNPLVNINSLSNSLRDEEDPKKIKEGLMALNNLTRQLDFSINNILNISTLDIQKIKIVNNKYDLEKLCHDLEIKIKPEVKDGVKFALTMPKQLPILYGDYMKLRQILYSLLINSCKNTENGNINLKVNVIEKYDICRLVINISDTGSGIPIEKINEIISATGELDKNEIENLEKKEFNVKVCQKVVKIMGGNLMIKSNIGEGTDIILTLDQKVYHEKENSILTQYENDIANYRKVLIVCQNKDLINMIKHKLTDNNITYSSLYYGADAIDRIKSGKKYDFILVEDEMKEMSGFMTFKGMKEIKNFNTPTIIMLKEDKDKIKEHYLEDGFKDYLLINKIDSELDRIIEKF